MRLARSTLVPVIVLAGSVLAGCPPIETKIPNSTVVKVPGSEILGGNPLAPEQAFPSDLIGEALADSVNQSFDTSGYDKGAVKSLRLTRLTLTVVPDQSGGSNVHHLGFLQKLTVFLGAPESDPIKVAESADGAFDGRPVTYDVPLTRAELAEVFKTADSMEMTADVVPDDPLIAATDVRIDSEITAQIGF